MDAKTRLAEITKRNRSSKIAKQSNRWTLEKKIEAVTQFLILGNLQYVANMTKVPYETLRHWKGAEWWSELEAEIRQTQNIELEVKLSNIVEKSLAATLDRVENGDFIFDQKSGKILRRPVALRDVHKVATDMIDRRELLKKNANDRGESTKISVNEHLNMLKNQMAQWFEPKKQNVEIIENEEVEDAVYANPNEKMHEMSPDEITDRVQSEESDGEETGSAT